MGKTKSLHFDALRETLSARVRQFADRRQKGKIAHEMHDCCLSAFAMMYFQDPSMLAFQTRLQDLWHRNNLKTLFAVETIPKDTALRDNLDSIPSRNFYPVFTDYFRALQRAGRLKPFKIFNDTYLISIDGTEYFESYQICCPSCLRRQRRNGKVQYLHQAMGGVIVNPDKPYALPLAPEPIHNQDGNNKQDCETNAGKRFIDRIRQDHPKLKITITGDSLYSKKPFIEKLRAAGMSYILVAKPHDHKHLFRKVVEHEDLGHIQRYEVTDAKGTTHIYTWCNDLALNASCDIKTNYFEYWKVVDEDHMTFKNSWVTDIPVTSSNVRELVRAGRTRHKIENESFNTLKKQGYHAEHNFGHGQKNLSFNFFLLILLAFFMHQILEMNDDLYAKARAKFSARKECWNALRTLIQFMVFDSWQALMVFVLSPPRHPRPP